MAQEMESFNNHLFDEFVLEELERRLEMAQFPLLPGGEPPPAEASHSISPIHCTIHDGDFVNNTSCVGHGGHTCATHDAHCFAHTHGFWPSCGFHGSHICAPHDAHCLAHTFTCLPHAGCVLHQAPLQTQAHPHDTTADHHP